MHLSFGWGDLPYVLQLATRSPSHIPTFELNSAWMGNGMWYLQSLLIPVMSIKSMHQSSAKHCIRTGTEDTCYHPRCEQIVALLPSWRWLKLFTQPWEGDITFVMPPSTLANLPVAKFEADDFKQLVLQVFIHIWNNFAYTVPSCIVSWDAWYAWPMLLEGSNLLNSRQAHNFRLYLVFMIHNFFLIDNQHARYIHIRLVRQMWLRLAILEATRPAGIWLDWLDKVIISGYKNEQDIIRPYCASSLTCPRLIILMNVEMDTACRF